MPPPTRAINPRNVCGLVLSTRYLEEVGALEDESQEEEGANYNKFYLIQMTFSAFGLNIHPRRSTPSHDDGHGHSRCWVGPYGGPICDLCIVN